MPCFTPLQSLINSCTFTLTWKARKQTETKYIIPLTLYYTHGLGRHVSTCNMMYGADMSKAVKKLSYPVHIMRAYSWGAEV